MMLLITWCHSLCIWIFLSLGKFPCCCLTPVLYTACTWGKEHHSPFTWIFHFIILPRHWLSSQWTAFGLYSNLRKANSIISTNFLRLQMSSEWVADNCLPGEAASGALSPRLSPKASRSCVWITSAKGIHFCHGNQSTGKLGQAEPPSSTCCLSRWTPPLKHTCRKLWGGGRNVLKELKAKWTQRKANRDVFQALSLFLWRSLPRTACAPVRALCSERAFLEWGPSHGPFCTGCLPCTFSWSPTSLFTSSTCLFL